MPAERSENGSTSDETVQSPLSNQQDRQAVSVLLEVSRMVGGNLELEAVLEAAMDAATAAMKAEACSLLLDVADADTEELCFHVARGERTEGLSSARVPVDDCSLAGWVAKNDRALLVPDAYEDPRFNPAFDTRTGFRTRSVICSPMRAKHKRLGVIQILNRRDGKPFDERDLELLQAVAALIAVAIDNAEQHEARLKAERLAAIGQTVAGMAHCIKNILNGIQGGSYIVDLGIEAGDMSKVAKGWDIARRNNTFLSNLVLDMLSYAKKRAPRYEPTDINDLVRTTVDLYVDAAKKQDTTVRSEPDPAMPEVSVDAVAIYRCIVNLISNAVDACATVPGAEVCVRTRAPDSTGRFAIAVEDTGDGMSGEVKARLFGDFFSTKGARGTGLGLPVVKKTVEEHLGEIEVESEENTGTTFTVLLPACRPPQEETAPQSSSGATPGQS